MPTHRQLLDEGIRRQLYTHEFVDQTLRYAEVRRALQFFNRSLCDLAETWYSYDIRKQEKNPHPREVILNYVGRGVLGPETRTFFVAATIFYGALDAFIMTLYPKTREDDVIGSPFHRRWGRTAREYIKLAIKEGLFTEDTHDIIDTKNPNLAEEARRFRKYASDKYAEFYGSTQLGQYTTERAKELVLELDRLRRLVASITTNPFEEMDTIALEGAYSMSAQLLDARGEYQQEEKQNPSIEVAMLVNEHFIEYLSATVALERLGLIGAEGKTALAFFTVEYAAVGLWNHAEGGLNGAEEYPRYMAACDYYLNRHLESSCPSLGGILPRQTSGYSKMKPEEVHCLERTHVLPCRIRSW
ncbi:hypothetical protein JW930_06670 [Candidatus Woesearchaeota archaeon]|nr:hypothetical protein [Candidatus Woesearchaeota archaeon]